MTPTEGGDDKNEPTPRKKTPRELVEMASRLEREEEDNDFFAGVRNFFGSIFPGTVPRKKDTPPKTAPAPVESIDTTVQEQEEEPLQYKSTIAETAATVSEEVPGEVDEPASTVVAPIVEEAAVELTAPIELETSIELEATTAEPVVVAAELAETKDDSPKSVDEEPSKDDVEASPMKVQLPMEEPPTESVAPELADAPIEEKAPTVVASEAPLMETSLEDEEELSDEDLLATIDLAQDRLSEGKIAGLEEFLAATTSPVEAQTPPPRAPKPAVDMETVAEMARRAVEEYERSVTEKEESSPAFVDEKAPAFVRGSKQQDTSKVDSEEVTTDSVEDLPMNQQEVATSKEGAVVQDKPPKPAFVASDDVSGTATAIDWSTYTVTQLKTELETRNLKKSGKKSELIARLEGHANGETTDAPEPIADTVAKIEAEPDNDRKDWSSLRVKDLKEELKARELPVSGKKNDLIARLEEYESSSSIDKTDLSPADTLAAESKDGESNDGGQPLQADSPASPEALDDSDDNSEKVANDAQPKGDRPPRYEDSDYSAMTITQLKDELKARGMPVYGNKSALIDRLRSGNSMAKEPVDSPRKVNDHFSTLQGGSSAVDEFLLDGTSIEYLAAEARTSISSRSAVLDQDGSFESTGNLTLEPALTKHGSNGVGDSNDPADTIRELSSKQLQLNTKQIDQNGLASHAVNGLTKKSIIEVDPCSDVNGEIHIGDFVADKSLFDAPTQNKSPSEQTELISGLSFDEIDTEEQAIEASETVPGPNRTANTSQTVPSSRDNEIDTGDFLIDDYVLEGLATETGDTAPEKPANDVGARTALSNDETDLNDFLIDDAMLKELAKEVETIPKNTANAMETKPDSHDEFDLSDFLIDNAMLEELANESPETTPEEPTSPMEAKSASQSSDDEIDTSDFMMDNSMLQELANEARETMPGMILKTPEHTTEDESIMALGDFSIDSSILDNLAEEARKSASPKTGFDATTATSKGDDVDFFDDDIVLDDFEFDGEKLGDMAELARQTVDIRAVPPASNLIPIRDWGKVPLTELRSELEARGLPTRGTKMSLVAALEVSDLERVDRPNGDADVDEFNLGEIDMDQLSKAARDAELMFEDDDEPSDEALRAIENELESELSSSTSKQNATPSDYESMAVSQLKNELKKRSLRVTGKKIDLIARLKESD